MAGPDTDRARLALAVIAETSGEDPLTDRYREEQALRLATFTDLDLPTARRVVEVTYQATVLGGLLVQVQAVGAGAEVSATLRRLRQELGRLQERFGDRPGWFG